MVDLESLEDLARKRLSSDGGEKSNNSLYLLGGAPLIDNLDWLDVKHLGFDEVKRGNGTLGGEMHADCGPSLLPWLLMNQITHLVVTKYTYRG